MPFPSIRGKYPFKLGTTSFVVPADIPTNIRFLKDKVDVVQLVLFEGEQSNLPDAAQRAELKSVGKDTGLEYLVHFPIDYHLGHSDPVIRTKALDQHCRIASQYAGIASGFVLHAEADDYGVQTLEIFNNAFAALRNEVPERLPIALENLYYRYGITDPLREQYQMGVCLDSGHLGIGNADLQVFWDTYRKDIEVIHLHGFDGKNDHLSLRKNSPRENSFWSQHLKAFDKTVIVEVFSETDTIESIGEIEKWMEKQA